ncbi:hypothetical protein ABT282_37680 [Streptomyces sp. NPDC000927]
MTTRDQRGALGLAVRSDAHGRPPGDAARRPANNAASKSLDGLRM